MVMVCGRHGIGRLLTRERTSYFAGPRLHTFHGPLCPFFPFPPFLLPPPLPLPFPSLASSPLLPFSFLPLVVGPLNTVRGLAVWGSAVSGKAPCQSTPQSAQQLAVSSRGLDQH